ncbi:MAG: diacylglycerol kinase family lipid kinase [Bacteroidetes bacterium]|nr:diacylglycerol kinase family lipid kinase [Bacteroidota bacterium]MBU1679492.1 diacylglycerol kinase family lipid kinase [Bacteroidota bacterium]MBU2508750.1 diacylglycerol kinase family lipid kinase [Bacteroidota bacterium]
MKSLIIYNNFAAHKRSHQFVNQLKSLYEANNIEYELIFPESREQAQNIVKDADFEKYNSVITAGGDGSLYTTLNGYMQNTSSKRIPLGVIPVGTGNAFVRDIGLDADEIEKAFNAIKSGKTKKVDIGKFITEGKDYYFINIIGMGFVTDVGKTASKLKMFGNTAYTFGVLYQTTFLKTFNVEIEYDGNTINRESIFIEISNTRYTGKTFLMAPHAKIDDGLLDVTIMNKASRARLLSCLPKIFTGEHLKMKEVETFQAKSIKIATDVPLMLTPDGELMGSTPISLECIPGAVDVFVNK